MGSDVQARVTITSDGEWRRSGKTVVHVLSERVRFTDPVFITGHMQIACGSAALGAEAEIVRKVRACTLLSVMHPVCDMRCAFARVQVATAKVFQDDTYVHTATGNNKLAMETHNEKAWRRASRRGMTVANGGVVHYKDEQALDRLTRRIYCADDLRKMRGYGYEDHVFVKGEIYLISVKESDPTSAVPALTVGGRSRGSRRAVTNLEEATLEGFQFDDNGKLVVLEMHVAHTPAGVRVHLNRSAHRAGSVVVESFPIKPYFERFAKLYQGLQFEEFHVATGGWNPKAWGLLGMAISRVKSLGGLKLSGVGTADWLRKKATANWKVVMELHRHIPLDGGAVHWAQDCQRLFIAAWLREDRRRGNIAF